MNLNSKVLKALIFALLFFVGVMAYAASTGQMIDIAQNVLGTISVPFQRINSAIAGNFQAWSDKNLNINNIIDENARLKEELEELRKKQVSYDRIKLQNEEYKNLLGIHDNIDSYNIVSANVIGRDGIDSFYSFTIDCGSSDGIEINDVVFSSEGVIGVVVETGYGFSKVSTILSPSVSVGCFAGEKLDVGIVTGNYDLRNNQYCLAEFLPKDTECKPGDIVSTSGYGTVFPKDFIIGTIEDVFIDSSGNYMSATVKPAADISGVKIVSVITDFN